MAAGNLSAPRLNMLVFSKDGAELGRVKEVDTHNFKIDVQFAYDYWVDRRYIEEVTDTFVKLSLSEGRVHELRSATSHEAEPLLWFPDTPQVDTNSAEASGG